MRPACRIGDINSGGGVIISCKSPTTLSGGSPMATVGDAVSPHDSKPTHFSVTLTGSPKVLVNGTPVNRVGDFDSCFHVRVTGNAKNLIGP